MVFVRRSPGRPGSTKVQIAERRGGRDVVVEHVGTARSDAELAVLMAAARQRLHEGQEAPDLEVAGLEDEGVPQRLGLITSKRSALLWQVLTEAYARLGFDCIGDETFAQLVLTRIIEPTSKADSVRVLSEIGVASASLRTMFRTLQRATQRDYRAQIATACFSHAMTHGDVSLVLYDVTTLYFEAEKEDELRKVGYSKERRVDPQIVVGLLVDGHGFPLEIGCFEGNKAETLTIIPIVKQFAARHGIADMVVVADAGMLSSSNLRDLDEAGLRFIVGSRVTKAPKDLESHFRWHGTAFTDGQVIDTITSRDQRGTAERAATACVGPSQSGIGPCMRSRGARCGPTRGSGRCATTRRSRCRRTRPVPSWPGRRPPGRHGSSRPATAPTSSTRPHWPGHATSWG
ncbi:IS1634 family transposase [Microbacterium sp.]|uniref:IS1634 family transposase n=1 Tax=Microbacterium sp. TaxID=51671 RepID=UPI0027323FBA|nr:IS1634 family transposase [Microbacterium sp.]MDP3951334.1 IS1634 family transposase [Microbacterium sp.]